MVEVQNPNTLIYDTTYRAIIAEAQQKAAELKSTLPPLPSEEELAPIQGLMYAKDTSLIATVRRHQAAWGNTAHAHDFGHLEWVATHGAYAASLECNDSSISDELRTEIIQRTWRLGLLHDLQRWRGFGKDHMIEGSKATQQVLKELDIDDIYLADQVRVHDDVVIEPRENPRFDIPMFSVFAADHLLWGLEWQKTHWEGLNKKNVNPSLAIHDYQFMLRLQESPNFEQTTWGQNIALPYVKSGAIIAKHIEQKFSNKKEINTFTPET